jgi:hypothetical protein
MLAIFSRTTVTQVSELRSNADAVFSALDKEDSPGCALALFDTITPSRTSSFRLRQNSSRHFPSHSRKSRIGLPLEFTG